MFPESFSHYPSVYYLKNRFLFLGICVFLVLYSFLGVRGETRSLFICLRIFNMLLWSYAALIAIRRRLAVSQDSLEYTSEFRALSARWPEVKSIVKRRLWTNLWWETEGLLIRTDLPDSQEYFVDLRQFDRQWRNAPLGAVLQMKAPHLFEGGNLE